MLHAAQGCIGHAFALDAGITLRRSRRYRAGAVGERAHGPDRADRAGPRAGAGHHGVHLGEAPFPVRRRTSASFVITLPPTLVWITLSPVTGTTPVVEVSTVWVIVEPVNVEVPARSPVQTRLAQNPVGDEQAGPVTWVTVKLKHRFSCGPATGRRGRGPRRRDAAPPSRYRT